MKKRLIGFSLAFLTVLAIAFTAALPASAQEGVPYMDWEDGHLVEKTCTDYKVVTKKLLAEMGNDNWDAGWYVVNSYIDWYDNIVIDSEVNLILTPDANLCVLWPDSRSGRSIEIQMTDTLSVYGVPGDKQGTLSVMSDFTNNSDNDAAGIWGNGTFNVYGGEINATGYGSAAAIGAKGDENCWLDVNIYGGKVTARSHGNAAGIGGGSATSSGSAGHGGNVNIYGGEVIAYSDFDGAGIGGGSAQMESSLDAGNGGTVKIYGGTVTAYSKGHGAGIGGGGQCQGSATSDGGECGKVEIYGGTVTAYSKGNGAGIGSGGNDADDGGYVKISGGKVTAYSDGDGAGIGGGKGGSVLGGADGVEVTISGGTVIAYSNGDGAGIGGGSEGDGGEVTISGGNVTAYSNGDGAGIGGGRKGNSGTFAMVGNSTLRAYSFNIGACAVGCGFFGENESGYFAIGNDPEKVWINNITKMPIGFAASWSSLLRSYSIDVSLGYTRDYPITYETLSAGGSFETVDCNNYIPVSEDTTVWENGCYLVSGTGNVGLLFSPVTVRGDVHLILTDESQATVMGGIELTDGSSLSVHRAYKSGQPAEGKLVVSDGGISGSGTLTVYGGSVETTGATNSPGITFIPTVYGSASFTAIGGKNSVGLICSDYTIDRGNITIIGGENAPGIDHDLTINGGKVVLTGGENAPGIDHDLTINGGIVVLTGGENAPAVSGNVTVSGGIVTVSAKGRAQGIEGNLSVSGGKIEVTGSDAAAIGGCLTLTKGEVIASGSGMETIAGTADISGGTLTTYTNPFSEMTVNGGNVTAYGGNGCPGIGGSLTVFDGTVYAEGGDNAAGIEGNVTVSGGNVSGYGGKNAPGIGGGNVSVSGGSVVGVGGDKGAGIGSGTQIPCGDITITGGYLSVVGGTDAAGIGAGAGAECGSVSISNGRLVVRGGIGGDSVGITMAEDYFHYEYNGSEYYSRGVKGSDPDCVNAGYRNAYFNPDDNLYYSSFGLTVLIGDAETLAQWLEVVGEGKIAPLGHSWNCVDAETHRCVRCGNVGQHTDEGDHNHFCDGCGTAEYYAWDGSENTLKPFWAPVVPTELNSSFTQLYVSTSVSKYTGWYLVKGKVTINSRLLVDDQVHLLLAEGSSLTVKGGIGIRPEADLTICSLTPYLGKMGKITVPAGTVTDTYAGIGSGLKDNLGTETMHCGDITINGGIFDVTGGDHAAAIGSGYNGTCGRIAINGGYVKATRGSALAEPIGAGYAGSAETVSYADGLFSEIIDGTEYVAPGEPGKKADCRTEEGGYGNVYFNAENGQYYTAFPFVSSARIGDNAALEQWRSEGGAGYLVPLHVDADHDGVCDDCLSAMLLPDGVPFEFINTVNVALESDFAVRFRGLLGANLSNDAYMEFTVGDVGDPIRTIKVPLSQSVRENDGRYVFTCHINVLEISEPITAVFRDGERSVAYELKDPDTPVTVENYLLALHQMVMDIWDATVGSFWPPDKDMALDNVASALLDYAHFAQIALDESHDNYTVGTGKDDDYQLTDGYEEYKEDGYFIIDGEEDINEGIGDKLNAFKAQKTTAAGYTAVISSTRSLVLDDKTSIVIYLKLADPAVLPAISVKTDVGHGTETVPFTAAKTSDGRCKIVIPKIGAAELSQNFTVDIDGGEGNGGMTFSNLSALSYAYSVYTSSSAGITDAYKNTVAALYKYSVAASVYRKYAG